MHALANTRLLVRVAVPIAAAWLVAPSGQKLTTSASSSPAESSDRYNNAHG